jgi:hypothetical protein
MELLFYFLGKKRFVSRKRHLAAAQLGINKRLGGISNRSRQGKKLGGD